MKVHFSLNMKLLSSVPLNILYQRQQAAGVADQFIQEGNDIGEFWPMTPLLLPAVQHQLVQGHGAAHGCRQSVALFDRQDHLETQSDVMECKCERRRLNWNLFSVKGKVRFFSWVSCNQFTAVSPCSRPNKHNTANWIMLCCILICIYWKF